MSFHSDHSSEAQMVILLGMKPDRAQTGVEASEEFLAKSDSQLAAERRGIYRAPDVPSADSEEAMRAQAAVEARFRPANG